MYNEYLEFAESIALKAKEIMLYYFDKDKFSSYKDDNTIVTKADEEINSYLIEQVKEKYPNHSVDGEEEQFGDSNYIWVCDPIDGTAMYAREIPVAVFSLALVVDGVSVVGVVYDPFTDGLYTAIKGEKAYLNGKVINVNDYEIDDNKSLAHFDTSLNAEYDMYKSFEIMGKRTYWVNLGSIIRASMCVASGKFNFALFPGTIHKNCDIAAVKVIVEAAGGKVTDLFGNEQRYDKSIKGAIISNNIVHDEVVEILKNNLE